MKSKELIGRISQKAEISPAEAFEALAATFQALIDNLCGTVFTTIAIAPDPGSPVQLFINVGNPPNPHSATGAGNPTKPDINVGNPANPHINVGNPANPHIDVGNPANPHIDVGNPANPHVDDGKPAGSNLERRPSGVLTYVAGRVGIPSDKAATALSVIFEQLNVVAREAGVRARP